MDLIAGLVGCGIGLLTGHLIDQATHRTTANKLDAVLDRPTWITCAAATSGAIVTASLGRSPWTPVFLFFALLSVGLAVSDLENQRLPFALTAGLYVVGLGSFAVVAILDEVSGQLGRAALATTLVLTVFLVLALLAPGQLGLGDVVLAGAIALYLGWLGWRELLIGLFAGLLLGAVVAAFRLATKAGRAPFPLGPALLGGWYVGVLLA